MKFGSRLPTPTGMGLGMDFSQFLDRIVRVDLGGGKVGMAQKFLYRIEVSAVLEHVCGESVAQHVGASLPLRGDPTKIMRHEALYAASCKWFALGRNQQ